MIRTAIVSVSLSLWAAGGTLHLVTPATTDESAGASGYVDETPSVVSPVWFDTEQEKPVVVFVSERGGWGGLYPDEGVDRDVFSRALGGEVESLSIAEGSLLDAGQVTEVSAAAGVCVEVRYDDFPPPDESQIARTLIFRRLSDREQWMELAPREAAGSRFSHPRLADDGSFIVYAADDDPAGSGDTDGLLDIYLQAPPPVDGFVAAPQRISVRTATPDFRRAHDCEWPDAANGGQSVVFQSRDNALVDGDTNGDVQDIFLWTQASASVTRINQRAADHSGYEDDHDYHGRQTLFDCAQPAISGNGEVAVYVSADPHIATGDANGTRDVFAVDLVTGDTSRASTDWLGYEGNGDCAEPDLDASGRFVVFRSNSTTLGFPEPVDLSGGFWQVFVHDRASGYLECVSVNGDGVAADADCHGATISPCGRYVTFASAAESLAGAGNLDAQVFLVDRGAGYLNHPPEAQPLQLVCRRNVAGDGDHSCAVALAGVESSEDPDPTPAGDLTFRLSQGVEPLDGALSDRDGNPLAVDGGVVTADQLPLLFVPAADFAGFVVFHYQVFDGVAWSRRADVWVTVGGLSLVSARDGSLLAGNDESPYLDTDFGMSGDGRWVAFGSYATDLTAEGSGGLFLRDASPGGRTTDMVFGAPLSGADGFFPVVSGQGTALAYVRNWSQLAWQALGPDGVVGPAVLAAPLTGKGVFDLCVDGSGEAVVFTTTAGLTADDTDDSLDVYLWRPNAARVEPFELVSQDASIDGQTDEPCTDPFISADGRVVAFVSRGTFDGGASGTERVWLKYLDTGSLVAVDTPVGAVPRPSLSRTGRFLAFQAGGDVVVVDTPAGIPAIVEDAAHPSLSASGRFLYFTRIVDGGMRQAHRRDLATGTEVVLSDNGTEYGDGASETGLLSASGEVAAFFSLAENLLNEGNEASDVFKVELPSAPNTLPEAVGRTADCLEDGEVSVPLSGSDPDHEDLRYEIVTGPLHGALEPIRMPELGGLQPSVVYRPSQDWAGTDSFTYRCGDLAGWSGEATVTVTVQEVNDPPVWKLADIPAEVLAFSVAENTTADYPLGAYVGDVDDSPLTIELVPDRATPEWVTVEANSLVCSPGYLVASNTDPAPTFDVFVQVTDHRGAPVPLAGQDAAPLPIKVTVTNVDQRPTVDSLSIAPAAPRTGDDLELVVTASDPDTDPLGPYEIVWKKNGVIQPDWTAETTVLAAATTKAEQWSVEVRVTAAGAWSDWRASASPTTILNTPPSASNGTAQGNEDEVIEVDLLPLVSDPDGGDTLEFAAAPPQQGRAEVVQGTSILRYTPAWDELSAGARETVVLRYEVNDGDSTADASLEVTVSGVNDPPELTVLRALRVGSGAVRASVLWDDTTDTHLAVRDVDSAAGDLRIVLLQAPGKGVLEEGTRALWEEGVPLVRGSFPVAYAADAPNAGRDTVLFAASDGLDSSGPETLTVFVGTITAEIPLAAGWNMVSFPMVPDEADLAEVFRNPATGGTYYVGPVWRWNTLGSGMERASEAEAGVGLWLYCREPPASGHVSVTGVPAENNEVGVEPGWHMVGPLGYGQTGPLPRDRHGRVLTRGKLWEWDGQAYVYPERLRQGRAFWLRSETQRQVSVGLTDAP